MQQLNEEIKNWLESSQIAYTTQTDLSANLELLSIELASSKSLIICPITYQFWETVHEKEQEFFSANLLDRWQNNTVEFLIVWEDRWHLIQHFIQNKVLTSIGKISKIPARLTQVKRIDKETADEFLSQNHYFGTVKARYRYGLYLPKRYYRVLNTELVHLEHPNKDELLVGVASFAAPRTFTQSDTPWRSSEMVRFCSLPFTTVIGGINKVIKTYLADVPSNDIMTYVDREWSMGKGYAKADFLNEGKSPPLSFLINTDTHERYHEKGFNNVLFKTGSFLKIYNSGNFKLKRIIPQENKEFLPSDAPTLLAETKEIDQSILFIVGPTASGKTHLATQLAYQLDAEIISLDSRQVYKKLDIGSGKDLQEYVINDKQIPYHLIDVQDPEVNYNVYQFQQDFMKAYNDIRSRGKLVIACGGSGLYIEAVINSLKNVISDQGKPVPTFRILGLNPEVELRRTKISKRLKERFEQGMLAEVQELLDSGISALRLYQLGLEYKFITSYLIGEIATFEEMFTILESEIHRFSKRQATYLRRLEKQGLKIKWLVSAEDLEELIRTHLTNATS